MTPPGSKWELAGFDCKNNTSPPSGAAHGCGVGTVHQEHITTLRCCTWVWCRYSTPGTHHHPQVLHMGVVQVQYTRNTSPPLGSAHGCGAGTVHQEHITTLRCCTWVWCRYSTPGTHHHPQVLHMGVVQVQYTRNTSPPLGAAHGCGVGTVHQEHITTLRFCTWVWCRYSTPGTHHHP